MRHIFIALLLAVFFKANANDTLTRAEVYNFSVGDTFDYRNYSNYSDYNNPASDFTTISYSRFVISDIYWSADTLTKFIVHERLYPTPIIFDTLKLNNLTGYEVIMDTVWFINWSFGPNTFIINLASYFGQTTNYITFFCCAPGWKEILFAKGLGRVVDHTWGGVHSIGWADSTILIYYSGANGILGTPYTSFPSAINDLSASSQKINVFPTLNNGIFTVETPDEMPLPVIFNIYDVQGKKVKQLTLSDKKTNVDVQGLSRGMYVWKAGSAEKFIGAGKVVIE